MLRVIVPIKAVSVANLREHWSAKAKRAKAHREAAHWALKQTAMPAFPCVVTLTRVGVKLLDSDNLASALKACRDGVADWLGLDDADPRVEWRYAQRQAKSYSVIVELGA